MEFATYALHEHDMTYFLMENRGKTYAQLEKYTRVT